MDNQPELTIGATALIGVHLIVKMAIAMMFALIPRRWRDLTLGLNGLGNFISGVIGRALSRILVLAALMVVVVAGLGVLALMFIATQISRLPSLFSSFIESRGRGGVMSRVRSWTREGSEAREERMQVVHGQARTVEGYSGTGEFRSDSISVAGRRATLLGPDGITPSRRMGHRSGCEESRSMPGHGTRNTDLNDRWGNDVLRQGTLHPSELRSTQSRGAGQNRVGGVMTESKFDGSI